MMPPMMMTPVIRPGKAYSAARVKARQPGKWPRGRLRFLATNHAVSMSMEPVISPGTIPARNRSPMETPMPEAAA